MRLIPPVPRLPGVPDPLRRIRVPEDLAAVTTFGPETDARDVGMDPKAIERIWSAVERFYRSGVHPAITVCLRREGQVVLNRAIGHARGNGPRDDEHVEQVPVTPQTPFVIFSASKAIAATVAHLLDERGLIHIGDRVAEYIPEFAQAGKRGITIEHLLGHRAGVPNVPPEMVDLDLLDHPEEVLAAVCAARPRTRPGKMLAYHAVSGGFLIGEIARRVTGDDIRTVLQREILDPLGFRWGNFGVADTDIPAVGLSYPTGPPVLPPVSTMLARALGTSADGVTEMSNDPRFLQGIIPSANVVTTAVELSRFFELLRCGGELDGVRILEPRTIRRALTETSYLELDLTLGFPSRYALGYMLGAELLSLYGPDTERAFGHLGFTNVIGWADPERELSGALVTSGKPVLYPELPQLWGIMRLIGRHTPKVPLERQELWTSGQ